MIQSDTGFQKTPRSCTQLSKIEVRNRFTSAQGVKKMKSKIFKKVSVRKRRISTFLEKRIFWFLKKKFSVLKTTWKCCCGFHVRRLPHCKISAFWEPRFLSFSAVGFGAYLLPLPSCSIKIYSQIRLRIIFHWYVVFSEIVFAVCRGLISTHTSFNACSAMASQFKGDFQTQVCMPEYNSM